MPVMKAWFKFNIAPHVRNLYAHVDKKQFEPATASLRSIEQAIHRIQAEDLNDTCQRDLELIKRMHGNLTGMVEEIAPPPPPVGIPRPTGMQNCAFNTLFQILMHVPSLITNISKQENCAALVPLISSYRQAQTQQNPVAHDVDMQQFRKWTHDELSASSDSQEDVYDILQFLLEKSGMRLNIALKNQRTMYQEPTVRLSLLESQSFDDLMRDGFFDERTEKGIPLKHQFFGSPEMFVVQADRCYQSGEIQGHDRAVKLLDVPTIFKLDATHTTDGRDETYTLRGVAIGGGLHGGHYIALLPRPDGWYLINDAEVQQISTEKAEQLLQTGYLFFYEKTDLENAQQQILPFHSCEQIDVNPISLLTPPSKAPNRTCCSNFVVAAIMTLFVTTVITSLV